MPTAIGGKTEYKLDAYWKNGCPGILYRTSKPSFLPSARQVSARFNWSCGSTEGALGPGNNGATLHQSVLHR